jgi:cell division protein ZapE
VSPKHHSPLQAQYNALIRDGDLRPDAAQVRAVAILQDFAEGLDGYRLPAPGLLSRLLGPKTAAAKSGLYISGNVGRGTSMLMDLFFGAVNIAKKRRVHFHQFMLEIHARLHQLQIEGADDVLPAVASGIAAEAWLLCFDEFHVGNIADAMILGRLFSALFARGVMVVATSNWAPDELYKNGLQRERFYPFIDLIEQKMIIHHLDGETDHRYEQMRTMNSYLSPLGDDTTHKLQGIFLQLTGDADPEEITLPVQGRSLKIMHAAKGVGFFNFEELCTAALGAADYLAIAECLHTVILDGVPKLKAEQRNETLRFMTLIDTLYEAKVKFFMGSAVPPEKLAPPGEHAFAFQRTVSRLMEMQGEEYRHKAHLG